MVLSFFRNLSHFLTVTVLAAGLLLPVPRTCMSAPPNNFPALFPKNTDETRGFIMILADRQTSTFEEQRERRTELDSSGEMRHYAEIRESEITFDFVGGKAGFTASGLPLFYLTGGYARADIDFTFTDQLTPEKKAYSRSISLESDSFIVLGGGVAARMYTARVLEDSRFSLGVDFQYRWLDFEADEGTVNYVSTLHEIQLALAGSLENLAWKPFPGLTFVFHPYAGAKFIHFIGNEEFSDPANTDDAGDPDPIFYTGDLDPGNHISFFAGTSIDLMRSLSLGVETRFGDDKSYGMHLVYTF